MLTKEDLKYNYLIFKFITKLHFFPVKFIEEDKEGGDGRWELDSSWKGKVVFKLWQFLAFCHASYILSRSVHSMIIFGFILEQTPAMIMWSLGYIATIPGLYILFDKWPELNVKLFNEFHRVVGQIPEEQNENEETSDTIKSTGRKRKTQKELLICYLPIMLLGFVWVYPIMYAVDRKIPFLLISILDVESIPDKMMQSVVVIACLLTEMTLQSSFIAFCIYSGYFVLSFSSTFMENAELEREKLKNENIPLSIRLEGAGKALQYFKLELSFFNLCFSSNIYMWRTLNLSVAIIAGFASIKLISTNIPFSLMYLILFINTCTGYIGMFNNAFKITNEIDELKMELAVRSAQQQKTIIVNLTQDNDNLLKSTIVQIRCIDYKKIVKSIPSLSIKSGGFNTLERESTLNFIDYVFQQITGLLISF